MNWFKNWFKNWFNNRFEEQSPPSPSPSPLDEPIGESITMGFRVRYEQGHWNESGHWAALPIVSDVTLEHGISYERPWKDDKGTIQKDHSLRHGVACGRGDTRELAISDVIEKVTRIIRQHKLKQDVEMTFEV